MCMLRREGRADKGVREVENTDFIGIRNVTTISSMARDQLS